MGYGVLQTVINKLPKKIRPSTFSWPVSFMMDSGVVLSTDSENRIPEVWKSTVYPTEVNNDPNNDPSPASCNMRTRGDNSNLFSRACSTQNFELARTKTDHIWKLDTYPIETHRDQKSHSALFASFKLLLGVVWHPDSKNRILRVWKWLYIQ